MLIYQYVFIIRMCISFMEGQFNVIQSHLRVPKLFTPL